MHVAAPPDDHEPADGRGAGRHDPRRASRRRARTAVLWTSPTACAAAASAGCCRWPSRPTTPPRAASTSTTPTPRATSGSRSTAAPRPVATWPTRGRRARCSTSPTATPATTTAASCSSGPTASSTRAPATAAAPTTGSELPAAVLAARQAAANRPARVGLGRLPRSPRQPLHRHGWRAPRDLVARAAQPVPLLLRPPLRRPRDRRRGPERRGGDRLPAAARRPGARRQLRLAAVRGQHLPLAVRALRRPATCGRCSSASRRGTASARSSPATWCAIAHCRRWRAGSCTATPARHRCARPAWRCRSATDDRAVGRERPGAHELRRGRRRLRVRRLAQRRRVPADRVAPRAAVPRSHTTVGARPGHAAAAGARAARGGGPCRVRRALLGDRRRAPDDRRALAAVARHAPGRGPGAGGAGAAAGADAPGALGGARRAASGSAGHRFESPCGPGTRRGCGRGRGG